MRTKSLISDYAKKQFMILFCDRYSIDGRLNTSMVH